MTKYSKLILASAALMASASIADAQFNAVTQVSAATVILDHHCVVADNMVGNWTMDDLVMMRMGAPGPRMSQVSGSSLSIACDGAYVEDAAGATITAGPDMPAIPGGHSTQDCVFSAGGSTGQAVPEGDGYRFTPGSAADVVVDQVNCGGLMSRFGVHLHMARNPWTAELSEDGQSMTLVQVMQSNDAGEIAFHMVFSKAE